MNYDLISLVAFYGLIVFLFMKYRERFVVQGKIMALYKTKLGLKAMDKLPKLAPRLFNALGHIAIFVGVAGMLFIFYYLIKETIIFLLREGTGFVVSQAATPLAPVLPGVSIPGAPKLSFWHWIISIFLVALVHEFSHGIFARLYKIPIKSSGFAILGPILGAFVEPDEKTLVKAKPRHQIAVFAAGPFSNFVFGVLFLLLLSYGTAPMQTAMFEGNGVIVNTVMPDYPMQDSGVTAPFIIHKFNGAEVKDFADFINATAGIKPGQEITLGTDKGDYKVITAENPENKTKGFIGIGDFKSNLVVKEKYKCMGKLPFAVIWINLLIFWLFLINVGVGMFNLLPLGPVDGGRMFFTAAKTLFKNDALAKKVWSAVSMLCLVLIFINLLPWVVKFFLFIAKLLVMIV